MVAISAWDDDVGHVFVHAILGNVTFACMGCSPPVTSKLDQGGGLKKFGTTCVILRLDEEIIVNLCFYFISRLFHGSIGNFQHSI
jgi:hypothetical protein